MLLLIGQFKKRLSVFAPQKLSNFYNIGNQRDLSDFWCLTTSDHVNI